MYVVVDDYSSLGYTVYMHVLKCTLTCGSKVYNLVYMCIMTFLSILLQPHVDTKNITLHEFNDYYWLVTCVVALYNASEHSCKLQQYTVHYAYSEMHTHKGNVILCM